jgi:hypothetical protein
LGFVGPGGTLGNKLAKRLWEQIELAKAQQAGTTFAPTRLRSVVQNDTGQSRQVETIKRIKQWWFVTDNRYLIWVRISSGVSKSKTFATLQQCRTWARFAAFP